MSGRKQAVVIGGSIAGLWTARVLADHFEQVTVIDRDHFPDSAEARKGAPQGRQLHVLLVRGQQILDQLFPGVTNELKSEGVSMIRWTDELASRNPNGTWALPYPYGYETMGVSRLMLEWHMRKRLMQNPKIRFVEGRVVSGVSTNEAKTQVTGVKMEALGAERASVGEETLDTDLVVDCSGRESHVPEWLSALGYTAPEETVVDAHVGYATRWYEHPEGFQAQWKAISIQSRDGNVGRSGWIYPIEHNQWITLMVSVNAPLPDDEATFLDFARSLPATTIYDAIKDATPISSVFRYQRTANQLRHYGSLERMPDGLILIGDAVCAFNPVFGQGMSVSAMEANLLSEQLERNDDATPGFALRFQKAVGKLIAGPWQLATSEDARNLKEGEKIGFTAKVFKVYMDHLFMLLESDPAIGRAFFAVFHLLKPPTSLFAPAVAVKVLRHMLSKRQPSKAQAASQQPVAENR